jgi:hypothetical protein
MAGSGFRNGGIWPPSSGLKKRILGDQIIGDVFLGLSEMFLVDDQQFGGVNEEGI